MVSHGVNKPGNDEDTGNCGNNRELIHSGIDASIVRKQAASNVTRRAVARVELPGAG